MSQENCARRPNPGQFKKGDDPRRHKFTREECSRGFWAAVESIVVRYPDAMHVSISVQSVKYRAMARLL
jgi:hypothetical protein